MWSPLAGWLAGAGGLQGDAVTLFWWLRVRVKIWLARRRTLIEFCKTCGREQPIVWHVPDELWLAVTGREGGVLCPDCFDRAAWRTVGMLIWTATPDLAGVV